MMTALAAHLDRLLDALARGERIEHIMRADELKAGHRVVVPGEARWFPLDDWDPTCVVSVTKSGDVRLVAIQARAPGNGALRRLIAGIRSVGLRPCVVEPTREMQATLKRWRWRRRIRGSGIDRQEIWHPRARRRKESWSDLIQTLDVGPLPPWQRRDPIE